MPTDSPQNVDSVDRKPGTFGQGYDARRGTSGGRPKALREIETMLDDEHRTVENMRYVFGRLKTLALDDVVKTFVDKKGEAHESVTPPDPAFMKLYLERVMGPVRELAELPPDAPPEVVDYLRTLC